MVSTETQPLLNAHDRRRRSNSSLVAATLDLQALADIAIEDVHSERRRSSFLDPEFELELAQMDHETHHQLTTTFGGVLVQLVALLSCVVFYTSLPIATNWAKTVGYSKDGFAIKRHTFSEISVVGTCNIVSLGICCAAAIYMDFRGFVLADLFEIAANGPVDGATYSVISQSRIIGTSIAMQLFLGISHSWLQWCILLQLTTLLICWHVLPNVMLHHVETHDVAARNLGMILIAAKCFLSVVCGTMQQGILHAEKHVPFVIQQGQMLIVKCVVTLALLPFCLQGFQPSFERSRLAHHTSTFDLLFHGWNHRVIAVLICYTTREFFVSWIIKLFSALVKILCVAVSTIPIYFIGAFVLHDIEFSKLRLLLVQGIVLAVISFALSTKANAASEGPQKYSSACEGDSAAGA